MKLKSYTCRWCKRVVSHPLAKCDRWGNGRLTLCEPSPAELARQQRKRRK